MYRILSGASMYVYATDEGMPKSTSKDYTVQMSDALNWYVDHDWSLVTVTPNDRSGQWPLFLLQKD